MAQILYCSASTIIGSLRDIAAAGIITLTTRLSASTPIHGLTATTYTTSRCVTHVRRSHHEASVSPANLDVSFTCCTTLEHLI